MGFSNELSLHLTVSKLFLPAHEVRQLPYRNPFHKHYRRHYNDNCTMNKINWGAFLAAQAPSSSCCLVALIDGLDGPYPAYMHMTMCYLGEAFTPAETLTDPDITAFWNFFVCKDNRSLPRTFVFQSSRANRVL
jgi:hypothetical protein